ncbi:CgeB family protein [Paenibacillus gansuensis]|uniref:Glycosyltransferase n=1 Tax=Paenibacillus gansuensis TaxID=306542 RepID=A0ABW5PDY5_9BACL
MNGSGTTAAQGRAKGLEDGRMRGWQRGYFDGQCDAALGEALARNGAFPLLDRKVLYVTTGIGVPYPAIDHAIIKALQGLVSGLEVISPSEDIAGRAEQNRPDLVLAINGVVLPAEQLRSLRDKGIVTAIWFTDDPYYTDWTVSIAPNYDYVFTLELNCVPFYQELGCRHVHYLPFGLDPETFRPKRVDTSYHTDICFIGTAYWNRVSWIDRIYPVFSGRKVLISGWWWDRLQNYSKLSGSIRLGDWMSAEETANYYNGAKIVINLHRSSEDSEINRNGRNIGAVSVNPRTFEIAGCGTLQLADLRGDMASVFTPGVEIASYTTPEELMQKIDYYLTHEEERQEIALHGLRRTMKDHTYKKRLYEMLSVIFPTNR